MIAWFGTDVWALISTDGVICCLNHFVIILDNVWSMKGCAKSHWPLGNIVRIIIGVLPLSLLPWVNFEIVRSFRLEEAVSVCGLSATSDDVMTSSNGNIFRVTGQFVRGIHLAELWCFFICVWITGWVNNRAAGDLRRYRAHYYVIVMENLHSSLLVTSQHPDGTPTKTPTHPPPLLGEYAGCFCFYNTVQPCHRYTCTRVSQIITVVIDRGSLTPSC